MGTFGERVRNSRKKKGITLEDIQEATGLSNSNLSKIERDKISPSLDSAVLISNCLDESLDYLAKGIVKYNEIDDQQQKLLDIYRSLDENNRHALKMYVAFLSSSVYLDLYGHAPNKGNLPKPDSKQETIKEEKKVYLPVLGTAAAGMPIMAEELLEGFLPVPAKKIKKNTYIVRAKGESMIDAGIQDGDMVIISPQPAVEQGEMALVKVDGDVTVKKFYRDDYEIRLKPANEKMKDIVITDMGKVRVLGKVVKVIPADEANATMRHEFDEEEDL